MLARQESMSRATLQLLIVAARKIVISPVSGFFCVCGGGVNYITYFL
jgi:hypothetical protein